MGGACLILPSWEMEDEAFFRQLGEPSCSQALVLIWGFNYPGTSGRVTQRHMGTPGDIRIFTEQQDTFFL